MYKLVIDRTNKLLGCDISKYQGKVDFFKMKKAGISFVIIRAGYGTTEDPNFKTYVDGAIKAGLLVGTYWFIYANNLSKALNNAIKMISVLEPYKSLITLGVWADWEYHSDEQAGVVLSNTSRSNMVRIFLNKMSEEGYFTGIYTNRDYIKSGKFVSSLIRDFPLWYAMPGVANVDYYGKLGKDSYPYMTQFTVTDKGLDYGVSSKTLDLDYGFFKVVEVNPKPVQPSEVKGVTVEQFIPSKGNPEQWIKIICNLKKALNTTFGLSFEINAIIDDVLLHNLANVELSNGCPLTDMNYVLQQIFVWWGYDLVIDGIYGKNTEATTKTFQGQTGLVQTGTTTPIFWKKILGK